MKSCVIGAGYAGLVTAACFAEIGNRVICVEHVPFRVACLRRGEATIYESGCSPCCQPTWPVVS
jgi:UDPglucose 6-dehydrogenase